MYISKCWHLVVDRPAVSAEIKRVALPASGRRFTIATLAKLVRLSYWARIQDVLPPNFKGLLPPKPVVQVHACHVFWSAHVESLCKTLL